MELTTGLTELTPAQLPGQPSQSRGRAERVTLETDILYRVIGVVASEPDLDRVLASIVGLLTEATGCHACFIYLREGSRLRLCAASKVYADAVGRIELGLDDSLAGWVARHRTPAFIRENALADPRMKYVPELQEERFQSIVAVPVPARSGEVLGVVTLHTVAPREFDESVITLLAHTASLTAGAIENARMYESTRRRVETLTRLTALAQEISAASGSREDLYHVVTAGIRRLLNCESAALYLLDPEADSLELAARDPARDGPVPHEGTTALLASLLRPASRRSGRDAAQALAEQEQAAAVLAAPIASGSEQLGVLTAVCRQHPPEEADELLQAVAHQIALALKQVRLIERLTGENIIRDLFEALSTAALAVAEERARRARWDTSRPHVFVQVESAGEDRAGPAWPDVGERVEERLRRLSPSAFCDIGHTSLRALLSLPSNPGRSHLDDLDAALGELGAGELLVVGRSAMRSGIADATQSLREAADAVRIARALLPAGGSLPYESLGAYKYLVRLPLEDTPDDHHAAAVRRLSAYDARRRTQLLPTLERFLLDRRSITTTARALYIHPNTLRQRLERIEQLSGLDLAREDLLSLELAVKLARLRDARGAQATQPPT
jgi:GAF domain-containing protein